MNNGELDDVDERIIYELQRDARHTSSSDIADRVGMSASTVRNRIAALESAGVIRGYDVDVDFEQAGYDLYALIVCTAPIPERETLAERAREVSGVVKVREVMTGEENVHVAALGQDRADLSRIGRDLDEIGLTVVDEDIIYQEFTHAFHDFGPTDEE